MTNKALLIAVICGLVSAMMLAAPLSFGSVGATLFLFAATPVCLAALGFGTIAGVISGIMAAVAFGAFLGPASGLSVFVFSLLPGIWAGHMAGLVSHDDGVESWFPLSTILTRLAYLAILSVIAIAVLNGMNEQALGDYVRETVTTMLEAANAQNPEIGTPSAADMDSFAAQLVTFFPIFAPAFLLVTYVMNLSFGARIARANGWMLRPKDDIPTAAGVEIILVGIFAVALALSFFGGTLSMVAKVVAGGTGMALTLVGFATLHTVTRGFAARGVLLGLTYALTIMSLIPAFFMLIFGLAETLTGIRAKRGADNSQT